MKHYGDITKISGAEVEVVDIITGGSPCQDLSVAGLRKGLSHKDLGDSETTRSGLFMEQIRIIKEMRENDRKRRTDCGADDDIRLLRPRFMVWENVPGAFSSNGGNDFYAVLEETAKIADENAVIPRYEGGKWTNSGCILADGWSIAWRVHDAQFWGVPQRRKRIALVADFGGQSAPEILFERKGLSGDIEKSGEEGQGIATDFEKSVDKASGVDAYNFKLTGETAVTLNATSCDSPSHSGPSVLQIERTGALSTLNNQQAVVYVLDCYNQTQSQELTQPLRSINADADHIPCVYGVSSFGQYQNRVASLRASSGDYGGGSENFVIDTTVRRLTPLECERLQGYPDHWTDIGEWVDSKGKKHKDADSPRYKALGNSIALPFWEWMAERMVNVLKGEGVERPTMASLFDGISGFCLVYKRCGCEPVWSSEVEEFCIAVAKKHFGDDEKGEKGDYE